MNKEEGFYYYLYGYKNWLQMKLFIGTVANMSTRRLSL